MVERRKLTIGGSYFSAPKTHRQFISSGSKLLDLVLGGGWAERAIGNVVGNASTGKTLVCIEACRNFADKYKKGKIFFRETETAFDKPYAEAIGMPLDRIEFGTFDTVEEFFKDVDDITRTHSKEPLFYVLDSLDATSSKAEMAREIDEASYGTERAKQLSAMFRRRIPHAMSKANMTMIIVSQVRQKINTLIGKKWTVAGGDALTFYASQRIKLNQIKEIMRTIRGVRRTEGILIKADCFKNKVGLAFRDCEFAIKFGFGIDDIPECLDFLVTVKGLDDVDIAKTKIKEYIKSMQDMDDATYKKEVARIHAATERHWYLLERDFLPKRRKYT
jgi:protein RecA